MSSLLDVSVRQLAWPEDAAWDAPTGDEPDPDDEVATFRIMRTVNTTPNVSTDQLQMSRSYIESIAAIDKNLHVEIVVGIVTSTLEALRARGPSGMPWQQVELAVHLVYTFGELNKSKSFVNDSAKHRQYSSCFLRASC